jgi:hypothetical protein
MIRRMNLINKQLNNDLGTMVGLNVQIFLKKSLTKEHEKKIEEKNTTAI